MEADAGQGGQPGRCLGKAGSKHALLLAVFCLSWSCFHAWPPNSLSSTSTQNVKNKRGKSSTLVERGQSLTPDPSPLMLLEGTGMKFRCSRPSDASCPTKAVRSRGTLPPPRCAGTVLLLCLKSFFLFPAALLFSSFSVLRWSGNPWLIEMSP